MQLARDRGLFVIEDCAQAHGAMYKGRMVGSIGDVAAFSFCQDKIMTTAGEGGMVVMNDEALWQAIWSFKDHGKSYDAVFNREHPPGFRWLHESFGTNFRMTEVQAAVGRVQLKKLPQWLSQRRRYAQLFNTALKNINAVRTTIPDADIEHSYYKYYAFIEPEQLKPGWSRDRVMQAINDQGVRCFSGSCSEIYLEKAFETHNLVPEERLPAAKMLGETSLMFLVHPTLTETEVKQAIRVASEVLSEASQHLHSSTRDYAAV